jgi:hypothetical protein
MTGRYGKRYGKRKIPPEGSKARALYDRREPNRYTPQQRKKDMVGAIEDITTKILPVIKKEQEEKGIVVQNQKKKKIIIFRPKQ